jgi:endonuclease-3 related protein
MNQIKKIYSILYKTFGPQGWWPFTLENEFHPKHHGKSPKNDKQRFEIIIGAILTQNTSWKNVEKAIFNLNKAKLIDINKIKKVSLKKLASLIKPSGYYNQKAEKLKIAADFFSKNRLITRQELLKVKGIGPETADSILLYAFQKPYFVIDAYTKRIFSRVGLCDGKCSYDELQELFHKNLLKKTKIFSEYHALIVELGKQFCTKTPKCINCPIKNYCIQAL